MKENGNEDKAELRSKRGIDEIVAGNRRAVRRSNSWVGSNVEVIKQSAKRVLESDGSQPPVTLICQKQRPNQKGSMILCVCVCVCVFIKLHITAQSGPVIYSFYATGCNPPGGYLS